MRIRVQEKDIPWTEAQNDWFYDYQGSVLKVVGIYSGEERLYAIDAGSLPLSGPNIDCPDGPLLIPSGFCELLPD